MTEQRLGEKTSKRFRSSYKDRKRGTRNLYRYGKIVTEVTIRRVLDLIFSSLALIIFFPLFILICLAALLISGGPVFYRQTRVGKDGDLFRICKFRTMYRQSEPFGPELAKPDDPRVTPIGRILRKTHLDELPQFWNVLKGQMTLVSYRPERPFYVAKILKRYPQYSELLSQKPGIISFGVLEYGYASTVDALIDRAKMDINYLSGRNSISDMKLIGRTIVNVVYGKGT